MMPKQTARRTAPDLPSRSDAELCALLAARALVDRMRTLYRELERLTGAPIGMHRALNAVGSHPGIQSSALAATLGMQRPAVSQLLKGLVERGWIERVRLEADQRGVKLFLTPTGRQLLKVTAGRAVGILQRAVQALDSDNLQRLALALPVLVQRLPDGAVRPRALARPRRRLASPNA